MNNFSPSSMINCLPTDSIKKNICRLVFWLTLFTGLLMMTYSTSKPYPRISPLYNLQHISQMNIYSAEIECSSFALHLLERCDVDTYIIPPVCPFLNNDTGISSWGPVIFRCNNKEFLDKYKKYTYNTPNRYALWNLGLIMVVAPLFVVMVMFALIGLNKYLRQPTIY